MKKLMLTIVLPLIAARAAAADIWQECQIESATMCGHDGCRSVEPTLKLYFGDYRDPAGRSRGYYYRCRRNASCDRIEDPWIGENDRYRVFVAREYGVMSRVGADGKVTDVATLDDNVLISRGTCWRTPHEADHSAGS